MFQKNLIMGAFLFFACGTEEVPDVINSKIILGDPIFKEIAWVCYNPDSESHGKLCDLDQEPGHCLVSGDSFKFCWELNLRDCESDSVLLYNEVCAVIEIP